MGMLQLFQDCGAIIREIAGRVKRILDMPAMFVWYFKEENTLRFWRLCGRIEKTRRKETAVTLQQLRYVTAVAGTGTISHAVQQFYISQPSLTNAIRELEQEVGLALSKTASSVVSRTLLDARGQMSAKSMHHPAYGQRKCQKKKGVQESRVPIKQYLQKFPKWGRFGVTSVTPFLLLPVHPEGCTPAHRT